LADGRNESKDRKDLKRLLMPYLQAMRDVTPALVDMASAGGSAPEDKVLRRLACQTIEELATLRELLPHPGDRELLPRPADTPPPKEAGFQEQEETALRLAPAPAPEDKSNPEPFTDLAPVLRALEKAVSNSNDPDMEARLAAVQSLGMLGVDALPATPALVGALRDPNLFIRWAAARALGEIEAARRQAKVAPFKGSDAAVAGLIGLVYHPDPRVHVNLDPDAQIAAIVALSAYDLRSSTKNAEKVVYALGEVAASDDYSARLAALATLRSLWVQGVKTRASTRSLIRALFTQYPGFPQVQIAAADLLGLYGRAADDAAPALRDALRDPDPAVRRAAGEALLKVVGSDRK
jgi:HEAT repeat protein